MDVPLCLLTRPEAQSRALAAELPGIDVLIAPILRIEPLEFDPAVVADAPGFVFTSANAVPNAGAARGRAALCVGAQTAEAARAAGFSVIIGPGDADGLLPMLDGRENWLHLHGRHRARELPVPGLAVYDQKAQPLSSAARSAITGIRPLLLPVFSPRSAELLSEAVAKATAPITVLAISDRAASAYAGPSHRRFVVPHPDRAAMVQAILSQSGTERTGLRWVERERGAR